MKLPAATGTLDLYIAEINRFPLLTPEEEFTLAMRLKKDNDLEAAEKLIVSNLRFVVKIAHEYRSYGFKLTDLIQEGNIGLIHAVKKFDPEKGYRLISYAVWWIRAYIQNYLIKSWSIVKIGTTQAQRKLFFKLGQAKKQLETMSKRNPEFGEIADALGVKDSEVAEMELRMGARDLALNELVSDDGDTSHMDFLAHEGDDQETALIKHEERSLIKRDIAGALAKLTERESFIIRHRVMADTPLTLQEIGDKYNITRERARQIEKQALKKVQLALPYLKPDD
ncbi:MAG TPA: RNA polymerase sigma factor RpoH [Smithellaceae bacterium]|mgnify:CR=1 FL=1|nr:RNA polymerase sigma factor RpoH [Syntrophaceae bacterium]HOE79327.1 RNA polymerase sigma factor RpoH [Smithellaceae bacterium]HPL97523.1 RNA polymerase sigma factor RpoH [Smithellaceae bacterium]HPV48411.1 RNA polymerase sigma factor RpoH [Smithellaceae bacterium]HQF84904.1 RNA polymerase sigma factor RpoH [Smithellaceae bacterium]